MVIIQLDAVVDTVLQHGAVETAKHQLVTSLTSLGGAILANSAEGD